MSRPKPSPINCVREGHNYQSLETYRKTEGEDTLVFTVFFCTKCCDVQHRQTAIWENFIPKKQSKKEEQF